MFSSPHEWVMIMAVMISLLIIVGAMYLVNKMFANDTQEILVRFILLVFTALVGVYVVDKVIAFKIELLTKEMDNQLFDLIKINNIELVKNINVTVDSPFEKFLKATETDATEVIDVESEEVQQAIEVLPKRNPINDKPLKRKQDEKKAVATEAVGKALNEIGAASIFTKEKISAGEAMNPNTVLQFDNVNIRSFNFSFKLVAESQEEAVQALTIENLFRAALYPEVKNRLYLEYPPTFKIKFYHGDKENTFMPVIMESFLSNMSCTYNAGSNMFHADGSPSEIDITLTFTETKAMTREALYGRPASTNNQFEDAGFGIDSITQKINDKIKSLRDIF